METMNPNFDKPPYLHPTPTAPNVTLPQMVMMTPGVQRQQQDVPYRFLYLLVVILDMLETVALGVVVLIAMFGMEMGRSILNGIIPDISMDMKSDGDVAFNTTSSSDLGGGLVWFIRIVLIIFLFAIIKIQMYGWKGFSQYHVCSIYAFMSFKILSTLLIFLALVTIPSNAIIVIDFIIKLASVIICILFGKAASSAGPSHFV